MILNADFSLNEAALLVQGVPWYSTSNAIYCSFRTILFRLAKLTLRSADLGSNLAIGATLTHVFIWFMPSIIRAFKEYRTGQQPDPHYVRSPLEGLRRCLTRAGTGQDAGLQGGSYVVVRPRPHCLLRLLDGAYFPLPPTSL